MVELGINIGYVSADQYASDLFLQRAKIILGPERAGHLSVDESPAAYFTMLSFIKKKMYRFYKHPRFQYELENLMFDRYLMKVDHPHNPDSKNPIYWKDVSDSVAGASFHLSIRQDLSFDSIEVKDEVDKYKKKRMGVDPEDEEEDFYADLDKEENDEFKEEVEDFEDDISEDEKKERYLDNIEGESRFW